MAKKRDIEYEDWRYRVDLLLRVFTDETTDTLYGHPWRTWYDQELPPASAANFALDGLLVAFVETLEMESKKLGRI